MIRKGLARRDFIRVGISAAIVSAHVRAVGSAASDLKAQKVTPTAAARRGLQFWGFDNRDPVIEVAGYRMSFQVFTRENTYGIAQNKYELRQEGNRTLVHVSELSWAAQQEHTAGTVDVTAERDGGRVKLTMRATVPSQSVRGVKALIYGLPQDYAASSLDENVRPLAHGAAVYRYPGWGTGAPVYFVSNAEGKEGTAFISLDLQPRPKRFAAYLDTDGTTVELIFEEDARRWGPRLEAPAWEISSDTTLSAAIDDRMALVEAKTGLKKWHERTDVPAWAREVALVANIHGMHWSGYIFNDYAKVLETVRWLARRIEGKRILVFLPGWEGRYYWQYGDYRPDPRLGGAAGFKKMIDGIHQLGAHVMLMFGGNCANSYFPNYKVFGPQSLIVSGTGRIYQGNAPDWDLFRNGDDGWQMWLNPGAPAWQQHLLAQMDDLISTYGADAVFLDTQPNGNNDARYNPTEGLRQISDKLRSRHPNLLFSTEHWYDLSLSFVPVNHTRGGYMNWPRRYVRRFAYLGEAEPSRGSTGVEEDGTMPFDLDDLKNHYDWMTVSFVDGTIENAPGKIQTVIDLANAYANKEILHH